MGYKWDKLRKLSYPDNQDPLDEGQSKPRDSAVTTGCRGCEAERQEEANPVEEECHWGKKGYHIIYGFSTEQVLLKTANSFTATQIWNCFT